MKIVQISSLWETTPPPKYGGLELVVSNLTEELVKRGHEVTLFATGDSETSAKLVSTYPRPLYREGVPWTSLYDTLVHAAEAVRYAHEIGADIVHNHLSYRSLATMSLCERPFVNTIHGTLNTKDLPEDRRRTFEHYKDQPFISISDYQRVNGQSLNWVATAYNGIKVDSFDFVDQPTADYLVWVGRFTPNKAPHIAIRVAAKLGIPLKMAAKLDQNTPSDLEYFEREIKPNLKPGVAEWVGEVGHDEKVALYKNARALLNPIKWDEPFGLVVAEAMACGTPVVTYNRGAMSELIEDGVTGFLINEDDEAGMAEAVGRISSIDRHHCRQKVVERFSVEAMADSYLAAYEKVIKAR